MRPDVVFHGVVGVAQVRKHPAPEGALRPGAVSRPLPNVGVRKHPAPEDALRRSIEKFSPGLFKSESTQHQKVH